MTVEVGSVEVGSELEPPFVPAATATPTPTASTVARISRSLLKEFTC